jgi:hypothetical protein
MKTRKWLIVNGSILLAALVILALAVAPGLAQETEPGDQVHPQSKTDAAAVMDDRIPIQGQLTDSGGAPLDGNYDLTLRLYDVEVGGSALCTDTHAIDIDNGLFSTYLQGCATRVDGQQQLYLGIQVESDGEMTPRQSIYPVPYALTLRPGAEIRGSSSTTSTLSVYNSTGKGIVGAGNSTGIQGVGAVWGVHGQALGLSGYGVFGEAFHNLPGNMAHGVYGLTRSGHPGSVGVFGEATGVGRGVQAQSQSGTALYANSASGTAIYASGTGIIRSAADTEIAVSPLNMIAQWESIGDVEFLPAGAYMEVRPVTSGFQYVYVPVTLPSRLFGSATKFESVRVCYRCDQAASSISTTIIRTATDEGMIDDGVLDSTERASTEWDCYTVTESTPFVINGSMYLQFTFEFGGTGSAHDIRIGNITLTLTE